MRKSRRRIKRRKRGKSKPKHRKSSLARHLNAPITTKWTKMTTYCLMVFEFVFVIWWLQELLLNWNEIIMKLKGLIRIGE
jgi:hypothetical protein